MTWAGRVGLLVAAIVTSWPAGAVAQGTPVITEVRIHGNHTTPDAEVRRLAGLVEGETADPARLDAARTRLIESGRFPSVEIRVRQRSLTDGAAVSVIILVAEHPAVTAADTGLPVIPGPLGRLRRTAMFLPILDYTDGYGLTYGLRTSLVSTRGSGARLSVPASWGGTRQLALEADRTFASGPVTRLRGRVGVWRRENPFYRIGETRREVEGEVTRRVGPTFGVGLTGGLANVRFGDLEDQARQVGAFAEVDTRNDPLFPRNAVYARTAASRMAFDSTSTVTRLTHDVRGYLGLVGQSVLATRVQAVTTSGPTPPFAKALLGGASSLRGARAGSFVGDNLLAASVELRVPFNSPLRAGRTGLSVFYDGGVAYDHGDRWRDRAFERGVGVGLFVAAPFIQLQLDVARSGDRATRVHLTTGISF